MAGIGMYGVFYKKCVKTDGVVTGYEPGEKKIMGEAIDASFTPNKPDANHLYANNAVAESDISAGSGGELTMTLDKMVLETAVDLYGTTVREVSVTMDGKEIKGREIGYKGDEVSGPIGVAYIRMHQEDGVRSHEVVFYREATFTRPDESAQTMGESIEWQTPQVTGSVVGMQGPGDTDWCKISRWPSQAAALAYIDWLFEGVSA